MKYFRSTNTVGLIPRLFQGMFISDCVSPYAGDIPT